jgi:hypothetical protein
VQFYVRLRYLLPKLGWVQCPPCHFSLIATRRDISVTSVQLFSNAVTQMSSIALCQWRKRGGNPFGWLWALLRPHSKRPRLSAICHHWRTGQTLVLIDMVLQMSKVSRICPHHSCKTYCWQNSRDLLNIVVGNLYTSWSNGYLAH